VYIALGANLGDREATLSAAVDGLRASGLFDSIRVSSWWETEPVGPVPQGSFLNGAVHAWSTAAPQRILDELLAIETRLGRVRTVRWGPRTIDLDLLMVGELIVNTETLTLPHPEMTRRRFVLDPLAEIAPDAQHPSGPTIAELLEDLE